MGDSEYFFCPVLGGKVAFRALVYNYEPFRLPTRSGLRDKVSREMETHGMPEPVAAEGVCVPGLVPSEKGTRLQITK